MTNKDKPAMSRVKRGRFYNPHEGDVLFDSSWEELRFKFLTDRGIRWFRNHGIEIPYLSPEDGKIHAYLPDILLVMDSGNILEEIKPASKVNNPVVQAKAKAAQKWCADRSIRYRFVTEKHLTLLNF